jgi:hypothetical protein
MTLTVVVPVSPIASHPSTEILNEALDSVRFHHPTAEILLCFDGVRAEQESRRVDYEEFIRRALWRADHHYKAVCPFIFESHMHQSGMMRAVLDEIKTPLLMYVESDCPLVTDEPIDWDFIATLLEWGDSNCVRLHHEGTIPDDHQHMMHGWESDYSGDRWGYTDNFMRTSQWSQRPHIATTAYYRRILADHFTTDAKCFIEDKMHGVVDNAYRIDGMHGWNQHRLHIYMPAKHEPTGDPTGPPIHTSYPNIKRSYTTDGRAGGPKFDDTQVW